MSLIEDMRIHSAVVWDLTETDRFGKRVYSDPYEIECRWENARGTARDSAGEEVSTKATIYVDRMLPLDSMIARGTLSDMSDLTDPVASGAHTIISMEDLDTLDGEETLFTAYI